MTIACNATFNTVTRSYLAWSILLLEEGLLEPVLLVLDLVQVLESVKVVIVVLIKIDDELSVHIVIEWLRKLHILLLLVPLNEVLKLVLVGELVHLHGGLSDLDSNLEKN